MHNHDGGKSISAFDYLYNVQLSQKVFAYTTTDSVIAKTILTESSAINLDIMRLRWFKPCVAGPTDKAATRSNPKLEGLATHIFFSRLAFYETLGS